MDEHGRAVLEREAPVARDVIGVGMRLEHARDSNTAFLGLDQVLVDRVRRIHDSNTVERRRRFARIGSNPWMTVIGVAGDVRQLRLDTDAPRIIYRPYSQAAWPAMSVTVKSAGDPLTLAIPVQRALRRIDPDLPVSRVRTMESIVSSSIGDRRFPMQLLGLFSVVALTLAAIGVYGVVSYIASQRAREIGIRVALGARPPQVTRQIVGRSLLPIGAGIVAGVTGARFASTLLEGLLYGVQPSDPVVLGLIASRSRRSSAPRQLDPRAARGQCGSDQRAATGVALRATATCVFSTEFTELPSDPRRSRCRQPGRLRIGWPGTSAAGRRREWSERPDRKHGMTHRVLAIGPLTPFTPRDARSPANPVPTTPPPSPCSVGETGSSVPSVLKRQGAVVDW